MIDTTFATGAVTGEDFVGGLVGLLSESSVVDSGAGGDVTGVFDVGGLVGQLEIVSTIDSSAALGAVMADSTVCGLVGNIQDSAITNTFATGQVTAMGLDTGGLVGGAVGADITNSFATGAMFFVGASAETTYVENHFVSDTVSDGFESDIGGNTGLATDITGGALINLQSATAPGVPDPDLFIGWDPMIWDFGSDTQLPGLIIDVSGGGAVFRDGEADGVLDPPPTP